MNRRVAIWSGAGMLTGLLVLASAASAAETYRILRGAFVASDGARSPLTGQFDASLFESDAQTPELPQVLLLDALALAAGDLALGPRQEISYDGLTPVLEVQLADQIQLEGDAVSFLRVRSGGTLVGEEADRVTFRFYELRGDASDGGRGVAEVAPDGLPRRLHLAGALYEVERSYGLPPAGCAPGVGPIPGGSVFITWEPFEIPPQDTPQFEVPEGGAVLIARVTGDAAGLEGGLATGGGEVTLSIVDVGSFVGAETLSLEQLGITAPSGATLTFEGGELSVTTDGDLTVSGDGIASLAGLTGLTLVAGGSLVVEADFVFPPPDVPVSLEAGVVVVGEPPPVPPPVIVPPPVVVPPLGCQGLLPLFPPAERELGRFSLIATAAEPIHIDVRPGRNPNRVRPGSGQRLPVAVLGTRDLDIRDLDPRSLRLGPGEAAPHARAGRRPLDLNRDRRADWLGGFSVRDAEIAFGDRTLCLWGRRRDGGLLEGCDAIDTWPGRRPPAAPPARHRKK